MDSPEHTPCFFSDEVIDFIFLAGSAIMALTTVLTHLAQTVGWTFHGFALSCAVGSIAILCILAAYFQRRIRCGMIFDKKLLFGVLLIGLLGATLAAVMHRPDSDDYYYVPNATYHLQHPSEPMGTEVHFFYAADKPFQELATTTATPYEYGQAALAYLLHCDFLSLYYLIFPALTGFLIVLAYCRCLSIFQNNASPWNLAGCLSVISLMLLLGETHRTIGGFSFARAFQGKVLFMAAGLPYFAATSYRFLKKPTFYSGLFLLLFSTAMTGLSTTALLTLPALAIILAMSQICTEKFSKASLLTSILYGATLAYVAVRIGIRLHQISQVGPEFMQLSTNGWPTTFRGHLDFMINPKIPLTPLFMVGSTILSLIFWNQRLFLALWIALATLLFLNPWTGNLLIERCIPANIYWRLFYLLPFPLTVGLATSCICSRIQKHRGWIHASVVAFIVLIALNFMHIPAHAASVFRSDFGVSIKNPGYKLDPNALDAAQEIIKKAPNGVMLAPEHIAGITSLLSAEHPQIISRCEGVYSWLTAQGKNQDACDRIAAIQFLSGAQPYPNGFQQIVNRHPAIRSVVMSETSLNQTDVTQFMNDHGFTHQALIHPEWILFTR